MTNDQILKNNKKPNQIENPFILYDEEDPAFINLHLAAILSSEARFDTKK